MANSFGVTVVPEDQKNKCWVQKDKDYRWCQNCGLIADIPNYDYSHHWQSCESHWYDYEKLFKDTLCDENKCKNCGLEIAWPGHTTKSLTACYKDYTCK